jgi:hypothetical protein
MGMDSKLQLSDFEFNLLNNSEWILTKNVIVKKAQTLLEEVQQNISDYTRQYPGIFPVEVIAMSPKISKGENYRGLPWLMLDYPRYFNKENIFAIRVMFWWGNFFSITLHLAGLYKQKYSNALINAYKELCENDFYTCISEEQWQHHFEVNNYLPVRHFTAAEFKDHLGKKEFLKLSRKLLFSEWNNATKLLSENFAGVVKWLN